ncbi:hypothetical protein FH972_024600 [Carpinus fangiana]|uniref:DHHA2 domain-containing protein n=1 Tax=Carpinus fangiana TaxID=176857 RepID=A0A5N6KYY1_9ROSI|nr:hypothetical protein FH972_024600 [Carpinus fangiana]
MAGNSNDERNNEGETNPFVTFRRFADEQISAALQTLDNPLAMLRDAQLHRAFQDRQDDVWDRLERAFERSMNPERKQIDRMDNDVHEPQTHPSIKARDTTSCPIFSPQERLARDEEALDKGQFVSRPGRAETGSWTRDGMGLAWNLDFFDTSPYSPLKLEQERGLSKSDINWRHAFEDLLVLDAADDAYTLSSRAQRDTALDRMPGRQWKALLLQSGLLSTQGSWQEAFIGSPLGALSQMLKELHGAQPQLPQNEYEFYEGMAAREGSDSTMKEVLQSVAREDAGHLQQRPSILSTFTKTERRLLPDGSTTTRTVLQRRFSDGTEENEETSDSTPPTQARDVSSKPSQAIPSIAAELEEKKDKSGGWFCLVALHFAGAWDELTAAASDSRIAGGQDDAYSAVDDAAARRAWDVSLAKLAFGPVLVDTRNLGDPDKVTEWDVKAATMLEARVWGKEPRWEREPYWKALSKAKKNLGGLTVEEVLRKDYKEYEGQGGQLLGIASVVKSVAWLKEEAKGDLLGEMTRFREERGLATFVVGTHFSEKGSKGRRELVVLGDLVSKIDGSAKEELGLDKSEHEGDVAVEGGVPFKVWEQLKVEKSRKQTAPLLRGLMA